MAFELDQIVRDSPESRPFWEALTEGRLELQRCGACRHLRLPPVAACPYCSAPGGEWERVEPRGRLYSWVVTHVAFADDLANEVPYTIGTVELEPGTRIFVRLTDVDPADLQPDLLVEGYFHEESGLPYLRFRPVTLP